MPKATSTRTTGPDGGVIDADRDPDGVSAALGLDDAPDDDEQDPDEVDETDEGGDDEDDEPTLAELAAAIAELKRDNAKLKREAAAARVKAKTTTTKPTGEAASDSGEGETPEQAAQRGRDEARLELGLELAGERIRTALAGIVPENDLDDFVDDLRLERYVTDEGKPDNDAIKALKERQAKITRRTARVGHARQGGGSTVKSKSDVMGDTLTALGIG
jgi:hypothetical protein